MPSSSAAVTRVTSLVRLWVLQFIQVNPQPDKPQFDKPIKGLNIHTVETSTSWGEIDALVVILKDCENMQIIDAKSYDVCKYGSKVGPNGHFKPLTVMCYAEEKVFTGDSSGELKVPLASQCDLASWCPM